MIDKMKSECNFDSIKVSVIVPVYNVEAYLERCLDSLVKQTLEEMEIIVVNDGTKDNSQAIIDRYAAAYPQKVISLIKENGGLSDARNYGIPYAHGEYIGFVDSDDYLNVTMYQKLYDRAAETDSDIVVCGYYGIDENTETRRFFQRGSTLEFGVSLHENPKLLYTNAPYAWNKIYRRALFERTGIRFPKGKIYEDIATIYPLMLHANRISKVNEPLYYYILKREGAITATFSENILQMYDSLAIMNEYYIREGAFEEFKEVLGFINLKHTILRFRDFTAYKDKDLQFKVVHKGFQHLDHYFDDWRRNKAFFDFFFSKKRLMGALAKHEFTWYLYSMMPNSVLRLLGKAAKTMRKALTVFSKRSYLNKYYYVRTCKKKPLCDKQVLFESFHGTNLNDSPFAMMRELAKDPTFTIYYTSKKELMGEHRKILDAYGLNRVQLIPLGSRKYQKILATSRYLVNNVSFPTYFIRREGQVYLNTWHGTPLKTLGKKMAMGIQDMSNMQRNFLHSSYLLHPNRYTMDHMMEDYNLNHLYTGKVILSGYPRNAIFWDKDAAAVVRKQYGMDGKETFAYMPTWRGAMSSGANKGGYEAEVRDLLTKFDSALTDKQIMYVNLHPLVKDKVPIEGYKHIVKFPDDVDSYSFLNAVDVLITDYSSVFFDFSITRKPIVLFMYDYDAYMAERGMYMDVRDLPFRKIYTMNEMLAYLHENDKQADVNSAAYDAYYKMFTNYDAPDNIQNLNDMLFYGKAPKFEVIDYAENKKRPRNVYLVGKNDHKGWAKELEQQLHSMEAPVAVFLRRDFNELTLKELTDKYNDWLDYTVIDTQMFLSLPENIKLFFSRERNTYNCDAVFAREVFRILPHLNIQSVTAGDDSYRNRSIEQAVKNERKG